MNDNAWERLTDAIDIKLGITSHGKEERKLEDRPDLTAKVAYICFERNGEQYKLERITGPALVDRKTHYSHRPGEANRIENVYDTNEIGHRVVLYKQTGDEWEQQDVSSLEL
ncbi:MAG TPA: hypothetical protein VNA68_01175 [Candidatus Dormibacteraeota bacterium]|nr:hypothetical protein [Candidatus Dormibacteraeota bacterium]